MTRAAIHVRVQQVHNRLLALGARLPPPPTVPSFQDMEVVAIRLSGCNTEKGRHDIRTGDDKIWDDVWG